MVADFPLILVAVFGLCSAVEALRRSDRRLRPTGGFDLGDSRNECWN